MRLLFVTLLVGLGTLLFTIERAAAFSDEDLRTGFYETVFGAEFSSWGRHSMFVKKFNKPVRVYIDNRAAINRRPEVAAFVSSLPDRIHGLDIEVVNSPRQANFFVYVVDRSQYKSVVRNDVYKDRNMRVPGRCLVRILTRRSGIRRSDAVIVSDEGEFVFKRCMVEEVLQGLGPVNDSSVPMFSVFNDYSDLDDFTSFDQYLLNLLYNPRIKHGMNKRQVDRVFDQALSDVRAQL